ncbi:aminotransferase class III-fold pyridoxal phosphate-dependent enzyme [Agaribacterium haliotis]|uniref:aminotransferase class III-fold pyridoxal phosphate-dependent enzyme n=1 Tax=Agaribacterium haliotis TaxID=2013869 RepID=UPI000BB531BB|nr:aminotransferase class III-fold pyridoxal phosphate-dependent enzyme [Agaribacterium haliotis]
MNIDQAREQELYQLLLKHAPSSEHHLWQSNLSVSACSSVIYSHRGEQILDFRSGGFGYQHAAIVEKLDRQLDKVGLSSRLLISRYLAELVYSLAKTAPEGLELSYICNSSGEAFEGAIKLAKGLHPERNKIVVIADIEASTLTYGCLLRGLGAQVLSSYEIEVVSVDDSNVDQLRSTIDEQCLCVVFDVLNRRQGHYQLPSPYLQTCMRERAAQVGALTIASESSSGFVVAGSLYASEQLNFVPDVVVLGKQIDASLMPLGAYITKTSINDKVYGRKNPTLHGSTTAANPLACLAGCAALALMQQENYVGHHRSMAKMADAYLAARRKQFCLPINWHFQGSLLSLQVQECLSPPQLQELELSCERHGLLIERSTSYFYFKPMLTVSESEWVAALDIFLSCLKRELSNSNTATREFEA